MDLDFCCSEVFFISIRMFDTVEIFFGEMFDDLSFTVLAVEDFADDGADGVKLSGLRSCCWTFVPVN